jgi:WD40 repeat protein
VWDATTGQTLLTYAGQGDANNTYALAWSPDSKLIASGGDDNTVRIWDAMTGHTYMAYKGHSDVIWTIAWSPDGKQIASASQDGTVQIWHPQV